jgi:hypothetical protein
MTRMMHNTDLADIWEQARENHERYSATGDPEQDLRFLTLGLVGEADVLAYTMMVAQRLDMTPADLIATVSDKQAVFVAKMEALRARKAQP